MRLSTRAAFQPACVTSSVHRGEGRRGGNRVWGTKRGGIRYEARANNQAITKRDHRITARGQRRTFRFARDASPKSCPARNLQQPSRRISRRRIRLPLLPWKLMQSSALLDRWIKCRRTNRLRKVESFRKSRWSRWSRAWSNHGQASSAAGSAPKQLTPSPLHRAARHPAPRHRAPRAVGSTPPPQPLPPPGPTPLPRACSMAGAGSGRSCWSTVML